MRKRVSFLKRDRSIISNKVKESFSSVLPITLVIFLICLTIVPIKEGFTLITFIIGALAVVVGMGLFTLGVDTAMTPIGEYVGSSVMKSKKLWIILPICFIVGVLITIAEPDLQVLAHQLSGTEIQPYILIIAVGVGVGVFLVFAFLRIILRIKISYILVIFYVAVFVLSFFVPKTFIPLAFDSGGVTTGPISVPFIIAIGTGVASMRNGDNSETDGFGLTALCSIGPIIAVMILGIIFQPESIAPATDTSLNIQNSTDIFYAFWKVIPLYLKEVAIALLPIVAFYFLFQIFGPKVSKQTLFKVLIGLLYTYVGLVLFLVGVNAGFLPMGRIIGKYIGALSYNWIMIPIGVVMGFFVVSAEPAVHVLTKQVYELSSGAIPKNALRISFMFGVALSVGLAMLRIVLNIPILYFLIPGYAIALVLTFFVPEMFTAIAFDSGGVASGAMTASFLIPLALGFCESMKRDLATQGFGVVALVAMMPIITIQCLGLLYKLKTRKIKVSVDIDSTVDEIIE